MLRFKKKKYTKKENKNKMSLQYCGMCQWLLENPKKNEEKLEKKSRGEV